MQGMQLIVDHLKKDLSEEDLKTHINLELPPCFRLLEVMGKSPRN